MTKDEVIDLIRREASQRGGRIGLQAFLAATGMNAEQIIGRFWAKWNDALADAGISSNSFRREKTEETVILEAVGRLIERIKKWPTHAEFALARHNDPLFPSLHVIKRMRKGRGFAAKLKAHCSGRSDLSTACVIADSLAVNEPPEEQNAPMRASIRGYVYMMRSNRRHKIGHTNSPTRRHREVRLDLPDPTQLVHTIPTDDPSGIEAYWHKRFASKRVRDTEFFDLDSADVAAFKYRKYQ